MSDINVTNRDSGDFTSPGTIRPSWCWTATAG